MTQMIMQKALGVKQQDFTEVLISNSKGVLIHVLHQSDDYYDVHIWQRILNIIMLLCNLRCKC